MKAEDLLRGLCAVPGVSGNEEEMGRRISSLLSSFSPVMIDGQIIINPGQLVFEAHMDEVGFTRPPIARVGKIGDFDEAVIEWRGNVGSFKRAFVQDGELVRSPGLDNKAGCAALVLATSDIIRLGGCVAFTTREETDRYGIRSLMKTLKPRFIVSVDAAFAQPVMLRGKIPVVGKGPAIQTRGPNLVCDTRVAFDAAREIGLSVQEEAPARGGATNLSSVYGVRKLQINVPVRDQHTASCETSLKDIENIARLLVAIAEKLTSTADPGDSLRTSVSRQRGRSTYKPTRIQR